MASVTNMPNGTLRHSLVMHGCCPVRRQCTEIVPCLYHLPQGFAYVEFLEVDAVQNAVLLDNSELRGRQIKVGGRGCSGCGVGSWIGCGGARMVQARGRWRGGAGGAPEGFGRVQVRVNGLPDTDAPAGSVGERDEGRQRLWQEAPMNSAHGCVVYRPGLGCGVWSGA